MKNRIGRHFDSISMIPPQDWATKLTVCEEDNDLCTNRNRLFLDRKIKWFVYKQNGRRVVVPRRRLDSLLLCVHLTPPLAAKHFELPCAGSITIIEH